MRNDIFLQQYENLLTTMSKTLPYCRITINETLSKYKHEQNIKSDETFYVHSFNP